MVHHAEVTSGCQLLRLHEISDNELIVSKEHWRNYKDRVKAKYLQIYLP